MTITQGDDERFYPAVFRGSHAGNSIIERGYCVMNVGPPLSMTTMSPTAAAPSL
jgi:hypothetical protein